MAKPPSVSKAQKHESPGSSFSAVSGEGGVCGAVVKVLLFVVAVPPMLNYAGLKQERDHLITNATLFDVGFGKRLFMSCEGAGRSTVILDAPTVARRSWCGRGRAGASPRLHSTCPTRARRRGQADPGARGHGAADGG